MSLNKKNPITIDQTISEYSNIEVTDVEYELYALNTQVNAMVAKTPIIRINFQVWLIWLNHSLKINLTVGSLKLSNCPDPKIKNKNYIIKWLLNRNKIIEYKYHLYQKLFL